MSSERKRPMPVQRLGQFESSYLVLLAALILVLPARGQSPQEAPTTQSVNSNVNEVSLDLLVHDKRHKPVLDLKPEDLTITDDGIPVKLSSLHLVKGGESVTTGHMITLVFDHFEGPTAKSAKIIADKILRELPTKGYSFAVLDFSGRLRLIQSLTDDRSEIERSVELVTDKPAEARTAASEAAEKELIAVARTGADSAGRHVDVKDRAMSQTLLKALSDAQLITQDQHARQSLAGLLALVRSQQQVTERKALIYFTQNEDMDSKAKDMLHTIAGAATRAGVSIYAIDVNSLGVGGKYQLDQALSAQNANYSPAAVAVPGSEGHATTIPTQQEQPGGPTTTVGMAIDWQRQSSNIPYATKSPMAELATDTGGEYIDAQDNVKKPLERMLQDLTTYYQAAYVAPNQEYDGKFRTIAVKPVRVGLNVQTRTGYFALPPGASAGIRPFEAPLVKLLGETDLPSDFRFNAKILRFGDLPDGNTNTLAVEIPISGLDAKEDTHTNLFSAHVSILAQIKDLNGTVVEHFGEDIIKRGALESLDRDSGMAISMERHFIETPGQYLLEIAVKDQNCEKMSAQRVKFDIPAVSAGPSLSDMVLVRKTEAFDEETDPLEPLLYEKSKITPNLSGTVTHESKAVSMFLIVHPDPQSHATPTLEMEVIRNGKAGRLTPLPLRVGSTAETVPYLATIQTKSLAPGDYEVKALITQGGKTAEQVLSFTVDGGNSEVGAATDSGASIPATDAAAQPLAITTNAPGELAITVPSTPIPPPTPGEIELMIADARERAIKYTESLPNFLCVQVTNRSVDLSGHGRWKLKDTIVELLRYRDQTETRSTIEVNGKATATDRGSMEGDFSTGELGGVLKAVFQPSAKAEFHWKETAVLGEETLQVFDYRVLKANSGFSVTASNGSQLMVGFHGQVYFDTATRSVRRISLVADDLPRDFPTHATSIRVDYDYVMINSHDYLMPVSAEMSQLQGRREATLNTIQFRDYKRYGSSVKLNFGADQKP